MSTKIHIGDYSDVGLKSINHSVNFDETTRLNADRVTSTVARENFRTAVGFEIVYSPTCPVCNLLITSALSGAPFIVSNDSIKPTESLNLNGIITRLVLFIRATELVGLQVEYEGVTRATAHTPSTPWVKTPGVGHLQVTHSISGMSDYNLTIARSKSQIFASTLIPSKSYTVSCQISIYLGGPLETVDKVAHKDYTVVIGTKTFTVSGTCYYNVPLKMPRYGDCIVQINITNGKLTYG